LAHPDPLGLAVVAVAALPAALVRSGVGQGEAGELDDAEVEVHGDGVGAAGGRRPAGPAVEAHPRIGNGGPLAEGGGHPARRRTWRGTVIGDRCPSREWVSIMANSCNIKLLVATLSSPIPRIHDRDSMDSVPDPLSAFGGDSFFAPTRRNQGVAVR